MGLAAFEPERRGKAQGPQLDLRTPESLVLVHEHYHKADDEKCDHCRAEEVVVAVDIQQGKVQFRGRDPGVS